jgi:hypothetical protein
VKAKELSQQRRSRVTLIDLLEEGIDLLSHSSLEEWVRWAKEERTSARGGEPSVPIRINAKRAEHIGLLAATIQERAAVPVPIVHLIEEAGRRILAQARQEQDTMPRVVYR